MDISQAYDYTLAKLEELREAGVRIEIVVPRSVEKGGSNLRRLSEKYQPPDRLAVDNWRHVTLHPKNEEELKLIRETRDHLCRFGICFDSGGYQKSYDWELDWSFNIKSDSDQHQAALDVLDDVTDAINKDNPTEPSAPWAPGSPDSQS